MVALSSGRSELLVARDLSFSYGRQPLLHSVNLEVQAGEMLGLLGPNGSGKTTLLRLLSGVLSPRSGEIMLDGQSLKHWGRRGVARRVAVVPQELHMPFAFTVEQMVSLGRTPFVNLFGSLSLVDRTIVADSLRITGIEPLASRVFNELSGGERQRVLIAMALAQQPLLLLLDEPTAHLDIKYQIETLELVQRLNQERGLTVLAALHDLNLAARYFPRLVLFQRGIVADAAPSEVLEPGLLSRVYGVHVQVGIMRGAEFLSVLPPGQALQPQAADVAAIHVMAGGGAGELLMRGLADAHLPFSAGVLNIGDSDQILALRLARSVLTEQPFAPLSPTALAELRTTLAQARLLIICPIYLGPGNLALLQEGLEAARRGLPVLLLAQELSADDLSEAASSVEDIETSLRRSGVAERDYTAGAGVALTRSLLQAGAHVCQTVSQVVDLAAKMSKRQP